MEVKLRGVGDNYHLQFNYNKDAGISACHVYKGKRFINTGTAICGENDEFCKTRGRKFAIERAISILPKNHRAKVWETYRTLSKTPKWVPSKKLTI